MTFLLCCLFLPRAARVRLCSDQVKACVTLCREEQARRRLRENVPEVPVSPRARARSEGVLRLARSAPHESDKSPRRSRQEDRESSAMAMLGPLASEEAVATFSPFHENDPLR